MYISQKIGKFSNVEVSKYSETFHHGYLEGVTTQNFPVITALTEVRRPFFPMVLMVRILTA